MSEIEIESQVSSGLASIAGTSSVPSSSSTGLSDESKEEVSVDVCACRICMEEEKADDLIAPCLCRSDQKWVHRTCLDQFRATNSSALVKCMTCDFMFSWEATDAESGCFGWCKEPKWELRRRIARDIFMAVFAWICLVLALSGVLLASGVTPYSKALAYAFLGLCATLGVVALFHAAYEYCYNTDTRESTHNRMNYRTDHCCNGPCFCFYGGGNDCNCDCGNQCNEACAVVMLVLLVVLVFIGLIYMVVVSVVIVAAETQMHYQRYERRLMTRTYVVRDLSDVEDAAAKMAFSARSEPLTDRIREAQPLLGAADENAK